MIFYSIALNRYDDSDMQRLIEMWTEIGKKRDIHNKKNDKKFQYAYCNLWYYILLTTLIFSFFIFKLNTKLKKKEIRLEWDGKKILE